MFKPRRLRELEEKFLIFILVSHKLLVSVGGRDDQKSITRRSKNVHPTKGNTKPMMKQHIQPL